MAVLKSSRLARYVNINSHRIKRNVKCLVQGGVEKHLEPVIAVRTDKSGRPVYTRELELMDENGEVVASLKYEPSGGLNCGARVYLTTHLALRLKN